MNVLRRIALAGSFAAFAAVAVAAQPAQQANSPLNSANSDKPVRIESATLEVRDKSRMATFTGDVKLTQGDMLLRCKVLVVFYEDSAGPAAKTAAPKAVGPATGQQKIRRLEARGDVVITQNDQTVTGDNGVFETKSNLVTVTGNVVVTQGTSVVKGERMLVEMNTGKYTVLSSKGRVESLIMPNAPPKESKDAKDAKAAPPLAKSAPAPAPPSKSAPMRLN